MTSLSTLCSWIFIIKKNQIKQKRNNMKCKLFILLFMGSMSLVFAQEKPPIIDMHVHSYDYDSETMKEIEFNGIKRFLWSSRIVKQRGTL